MILFTKHPSKEIYFFYNTENNAYHMSYDIPGLMGYEWYKDEPDPNFFIKECNVLGEFNDLDDARQFVKTTYPEYFV